jgi:hypothetical protein
LLIGLGVLVGGRFREPYKTIVSALIIMIPIVIIFVLHARFNISPAFIFPRGRPLEKCAPPHEIASRPLSRSSIDSKPDSQLLGIDGGVAFVTHVEHTRWIEPPREVDEDACVDSCGTLRDKPRCARAELTVCFAIHNKSGAECTLYDIRAHLYHVSSGYTPASAAYEPRHRVELTADNSICPNGGVFHIPNDEAAYIDLVFHTSLFDDTTRTLLVFGLFAFVEVQDSGRIVRQRIPSDKLYVFDCSEDGTGPISDRGTNANYFASFISVDASYLQQQMNATRGIRHWMPDTAMAQTHDEYVIWRSLSEMLDAHLKSQATV